MPTRKEFLKTAAKSAAALALSAYFSKLTKARSNKGLQPNILWITMEDTCIQFLGCYGNKAARTPNMDRLAAHGVRFDNAFSSAPVCAPSRSNIITGCRPGCLGTGHHRSNYSIPDFIKGFPYYLKQEGYFTSNNLKTDYNLGNSQHFIHEAWNESHGSGGWGTSFGNNKDTFDESSEEGGWWHRGPGQPFFSVFNLMNSHQSRTMTHPYKWYEEYVLDKISEESRISSDKITVPPFYRDSPEMRKQLCRVYNSLQYTDYELGGILNRLEKDGLKDDTIVFCFADHGEGIPKAKMSEVGLGFQVPFIIYFPPKLQHLSPWPAGKAADELVSSSDDVAPTILSIAGVRTPHYMTGRALVGKQRQSVRPYVFSGRNRIDESPSLSRCATDGEYFYTRVFMPQLPLVKFAKYMEVGEIMRTVRSDYESGLLNEAQLELVRPQQPVEYLFDLKKDEWQINNLARKSEYHDKLDELRQALQDHLLQERDIHFMPEYEMVERCKGDTAYHLRMDEKQYPFNRILEAANLVGWEENIPKQFALLDDSDATVRYWAAVGLDCARNRIQGGKKDVLSGLKDPHPSVRIVMAGIAYKLYKDSTAFDMLKGFLYDENEYLQLHALQTIEYMRNKAIEFLPYLKTQKDRVGKKNKLNYVITSITETTLHFLEGAPLYYKKFEKWFPEEQMKPDNSVHFID